MTVENTGPDQLTSSTVQVGEDSSQKANCLGGLNCNRDRFVFRNNSVSLTIVSGGCLNSRYSMINNNIVNSDCTLFY